MELSDITRGFESGDFARPNLFLIEIPYLGKSFTLRAKASSAPAANVDEIKVGFMNRKLSLGGDRTYENWTCTCYTDEKHESRQTILDWQNLVHGQGNEITGSSPANYKKQAIIRHYGRDGKTITKEYTVVGAWPTVVGEVVLDWDQNSEVEMFEVTFAYDYWE